MKVLMLISELGYGGAESAFLRLAKELAKAHEVEIAVFQESYANAAYTAVPVIGAPTVHSLRAGTNGNRVTRWAARAASLRALKNSFGADVTISFLSGPNLLNCVSGGAGKIIASIRGSRRHEANSSRGERLIYRQLIDPIVARRADAIVCVSEGLRREMEGSRRGPPSSKFVTISGYVDSEAIVASSAADVDPDLAPLAEYPVIVAAGRLSREKGFQHLIPLFARLKDRVPAAKLLLIGDGPLREELQRSAESLGLICDAESPAADRDVVFAGYRSKPNSYFKLARVFVLASSNEGFPNILVEALASPARIVAVDAPWGAREVLGVAADPLNRPFPRTAPLTTPLGTLMPRMDDSQFATCWVECLEWLLKEPRVQPDELAARRQRVDELDCRTAAERWSQLIDDVISRS